MSLKKIVRNTVAGLSLLVLANSSMYTLQQSDQAVVTTFGNPTKVLLNPISTSKSERDSLVKAVTADITAYATTEKTTVPKIDDSGAGLKFKLPWQKVYTFDRRLLEWDGAPEQIPTKDKKYLFVDGTARWRIVNPYTFLKTLSGQEGRGHGKLDDLIDGAVREKISGRDAIESIRSSNRKMFVADKEMEESVSVDSIYEGREKLVTSINYKVNNQCSRFGIDVVDFLIKRLVYEESVKKSVEGRMISERNRISEKYKSEGEGEYQKIMGEKDRDLNRITSGAYKNAEQIKGRGDAEATKIYNKAFTLDPEFYSFYKSLEVMKDNVKDATLILDSHNQLMQYITGSKK